MRCAACATSLPDDAAFCVRCGAPVAKSADAAPPDPIRLALERALGAQYEIGKVIGRGGMGAVYFGRERSLERDVAIKVLPPSAADMSPDSRERFRREARTAAQLTHSNIVPLYTFGEAEGMPFFVMGFVRGESLGARLARQGRMEVDEAIRILTQLADALDFAHRKGVVHRDVKPDNVMLDDETGRPMLTDFGIAKGDTAGATITRTGVVVGTPAYMSPEQATGERTIDGRSDLYALGVLGYEMLAGRAPFDGRSVQELLVQHLTQAPATLSSVAPDVPEGVAVAVMRCLEKDPAHRFADGQALRKALESPADSDELLREDLRGIVGYVPQVAIFAYVGLLVIVALIARGGLASEFDRLGMMMVGGGFLTLPATGFVLAARLRWSGHSWREIRRVALLAPRWWPVWWPRRWSRPSVASRLPANIRRWRWTYAWFVGLTLGVAVPAGVAALFAGAPLRETLMNVAIGSLLVGEIPWLAAFFRAARWGKKLGLEQRESAGLMQRPLASEFWQRPRIAALLDPEVKRSRGDGGPMSVPELLRAIGESVHHLGVAYREVTQAATSTARDAADEVDALDRAIAALSAESDPAELARLEARIAGLAADSPVRPLLVTQLELLRSLKERIDRLVQRRARVAELLRTLCLQLANLRALKAVDGADVSEVTGRIRALCASVAIEISAEREAAALLG
jgi:predicted Ser/Thr protein kinase